MSKTKEYYHDQIEAGQRGKVHPIGWLNMPGYKPETWNPIIGCTKVSPGCNNCYAERMAIRLAHMPGAMEYSNVVRSNPSKWNGKTAFVESAITKPLQWKSPRMVFVCSMSDLFHEQTDFEKIDSVFSVMSDLDQHIYILLTKRPERILEFFCWKILRSGYNWRPKDNIWIGGTAENQEQYNKRIPILMKIPASKRFVSIEPMLEPIDISFIRNSSISGFSPLEVHPISSPNKPFIDWVICGGESGSKARPMHPDWVRSIRDQCEKAGTPFFFKQWGEWKPFEEGDKCKTLYSWANESETNMKIVSRVGRKAAGDLLDGKQYHEWPKINL